MFEDEDDDQPMTSSDLTVDERVEKLVNKVEMAIGYLEKLREDLNDLLDTIQETNERQANRAEWLDK